MEIEIQFQIAFSGDNLTTIDLAMLQSRHTRPGSLKTCIYEGVRNSSLSETSIADISELVSADIVLTTYDVLKEDLSHDFDGHEGDRAAQGNLGRSAILTYQEMQTVRIKRGEKKYH